MTTDEGEEKAVATGGDPPPLCKCISQQSMYLICSSCDRFINFGLQVQQHLLLLLRHVQLQYYTDLHVTV